MKNKLNIHTLLHVPFEGLGCIEEWIAKNNYSLSYTHFYEKYQLPEIEKIDWLIIMGGPMGVYDEIEYPWLTEEKAYIKNAIMNGKTVLGICLGSQLIAEVLGSKVYPNKQKEIGWFNIYPENKDISKLLFELNENEINVFHWHGDTFDLPTGSTRLMSSAVCQNQAFLYENKVLGLQFHLEVTEKTLKGMVENGMNELVENETIQSARQILEQASEIERNNKKMFRILDHFAL